MKMEETNVHLIEECRRGNRTAQLALYKQFAQRLYVACLRIVGNVPEAEEAMQDSFLKIFTRLDQYRDGQCFEAWMHRIAVHTAIDYVRRQTPDWEELSDDYTEPDDDGPDEEEIRYLCGNAPKSVFARNYCAYDDPRELAKLAAVVEHYIFSLMSASDTALDFKINRSGEDYAIAAAPGSRISGDLTVDLSKISHDNLEAGRDLLIDFKANDTIFVTTELDLEEN